MNKESKAVLSWSKHSNVGMKTIKSKLSGSSLFKASQIEGKGMSDRLGVHEELKESP